MSQDNPIHHQINKVQTGAVNIGLSKNLSIPISVRIHHLLAVEPPHLVPSSQKYKSAQVFQRLSDISANSELFVAIRVFDGNHNPLTSELQTPYRAFSSNKRVWDCFVKLPINYSQVSYDSYLIFTVYEIVNTQRVMFGQGSLSLFNHTNSSLRKGSFKVAIAMPHDTGARQIDYGDSHAANDMERKLFKYENGEFPRLSWLDRWAMAIIEKQENGPSHGGGNLASGSQHEETNSATHFLFLELPNFSVPVVFSDITYHYPHVRPSTTLIDEVSGTEPTPNVAMVVSSVDIPTSSVAGLPKLYDPDFYNLTVQSFNSAREEQLAGGSDASLDSDMTWKTNPIDSKFQKLAININNTSLLDKEVKPSPHMRDELWRILQRPSSAVLSDHEKKLLWKFRYYFSRNSLSDDSGTSPAQSHSTKQFFTKFLKCFNWENEHELDHAFKEILPYWSVDKIDIGDALELLSNNFNPQTLTASLRRRLIATTGANSKEINTAEEQKIEKIFRYTKTLRVFAVDRLRLASENELLLYLLQLVQALKYEPLSRKNDSLGEAPLAKFLIDKAVKNAILGNYFYWYVKVENEDQLNRAMAKPLAASSVNGATNSIYHIVLNLYIERLKSHSQTTKSPQYKHLKAQIAFIKKLTSIVELMRSSFRKNDATGKKVQFLQDYLADSSNGMLKFSEPFPLPLDPSVMVCGCYPAESSVFKSSMAPLKITFKTFVNDGNGSSASSSIFGNKKNEYSKYALMFKIGDDLRQDQLVIQIINLMDQLLKKENLDLKLTPYKILATSPVAGMIQFIPNETLDAVLGKPVTDTGNLNPESGPANRTTSEGSAPKNGILTYLQRSSRQSRKEESDERSILGAWKGRSNSNSQQAPVVTDLGVSSIVMDNYVKSCAGYCVITYILGVGDRHLDNLLLSPDGKFWHADFGYILGRDPKPFPPLMKLPIQVIDGMGGMNHENFNVFKSYCFITYSTLRRNSNLILNLFQLMLNANIPDIQIDPKRAIEKVQDKFNLEMSEEEAILHFQNLIIDSVNAFLPVVIDTLHSLAQYWRA